MPDSTAQSATTSQQITQPRVLRIVRLLWVMLTLFFILQLPIRIPHFLQDCGCAPDIVTAWNTLGVAQAARILFTVANSISFITCLSLSSILLWRKGNDRVALLFAFFFLMFTGNGFYSPGALPAAWWDVVTDISYFLFLTSAFGILFLFPDGTFIPRWMRWLFVAGCILSLNVFLPSSDPIYRFSATARPLVVLLGVSGLIYRYRRATTQLRRQQIKWLLLASALNVALFIFFTFIPAPIIANMLAGSALRIFADAAAPLGAMLIPIAVTFALLRFRLWDVDLVINRSLVYGIVTGLALLIFFGVLVLLQVVVGQTQIGVALFIALLVIALIFNPLRKRVQNFVDRRIYRFKFDLNQLAAAQKKPEVHNPGTLTGRVIGGYEVLGVLGKGGMGEVYKGFAEGQTVALKILPQELAHEPEFRGRFAREAEAMRALNHPNIVKLMSSGESEDIHYLALEYVEGSDLSDYLKQHGHLTVDNARDIVAGLASALDYAHAQGIVHRDIKPSNVMLRHHPVSVETLRAVLMDFGIAKLSSAKTRFTGSGAIGTIDYMAPEQIMAAKEVDHRADIYAFGVMCYEMLTGHPPFTGAPAQVMFAHIQQPAPDPRAHNSDIPHTVAKALLKALEKDAPQRFSSAGEFVAAWSHEG